MTDAALRSPLFAFESFRMSVALAVVCAALSVPFPVFLAPTATLGALALAAWISFRRRHGLLAWRRLGPASGAGIAALAVGTVVFLAPPSWLASFRGVILGGGLLLLFASERIQSSRRASELPAA